MSSWILRNCFASDWHREQTKNSPLSLNEPSVRGWWQTTHVAAARVIGTSLQFTLDPAISVAGLVSRLRTVRSVAAVGEPVACSAEAGVVAEEVPAGVLTFVSTQRLLELAKRTGTDKRIGKT